MPMGYGVNYYNNWRYDPPFQTWNTMPNYPPPSTYSGSGSHLQGAPQMQSQQRPGMSNVIKVAGPESSKAYPTGPNAFMTFFDESNPIFYSKVTDDGGFPTMRAFEFHEVPFPEAGQPVAVKPAADDVSKLQEEVETLKHSIAATDEIAVLREKLGALQEDVLKMKDMLERLVD